MKIHRILFLASLLAAGCSDPADKVPKTTASEPKKPAGESASSSKEYVIRAESTIGFTASKVTRTHNGGFKKVAGKIPVADGKIAGAPEIKIDLTSLWADDDRLTGHLKSPDFFNVQKYPVATFAVTAVEGAGAQSKVTGNLDLHGVTKSISFPATIEIKDNNLLAKADFAINRRDFNINYPGMPNDLIRDNVVIKLDLKASPGPARPEDLLATP